jgi:hypothetical protein
LILLWRSLVSDPDLETIVVGSDVPVEKSAKKRADHRRLLDTVRRETHADRQRGDGQDSCHHVGWPRRNTGNRSARMATLRAIGTCLSAAAKQASFEVAAPFTLSITQARRRPPTSDFLVQDRHRVLVRPGRTLGRTTRR